MEVVASLPNILKVFPLKVVMASEGFPAAQRETFFSQHEAACEEMEEGEIDTREACMFSAKGNGAQHPRCSSLPANLVCIEDSTVFSSSARCLPRLSSTSDDVQLDQSVGALLSLPDRLSLQGGSKICNENRLAQFSSLSQSGRHNRSSSPGKQAGSSPAKKTGISPVKKAGLGSSLIVKTSPQSSPVSCRKACPTPPKPSQSVILKLAPRASQGQLPSPPKTSISAAKVSQEFSSKTPTSAPSKSTQVSSCAVSRSRRPTELLPAGQFILALPSHQQAERSSSRKRQAPSRLSKLPQTSSPVLPHQTPAHSDEPLDQVQQCLNLTPDERLQQKPAVADVDSRLPTALKLPAPLVEGEHLVNPSQQFVKGSKLFYKDLQDASHLDSLADLSSSRQHYSTCTAEKEWTAPQPPCMESSMQLKQHGQPSVKTISPQNHHHQSSSYLLPAQASAPDCQPQVLFGLNGVQFAADSVDFAVKSSSHERAYITCANGKRRPRSFAVRDYPEGCGAANQVQQQPFFDTSHGKATLKLPAVKSRAFSGSSSVVKVEQRQWKDLVGPPENKLKKGNVLCDAKPPVARARDESDVCLYKSQKANGLPLKRQNAQILVLEKSEDQWPTHCSLEKTKKKVKTRPLSSIESSGMQGLLSSTQERSSPTSQWLPMADLFGYNGLTSKVRPVLTHGVPGLSTPSGEYKKSEGFHGASPRFLVKRTLQEFDCVRRNLAMTKGCHQRPDLAAAKILKNKGRWRNCGEEKIIGDVPGVEVGDQFSFRIEMLIIGLHRQVQGGIDFISGSVRPKGPLATSIVASGGYEDDDDFGTTFIYTGQGGNNYKGDRRQGKDQELTRGNLALSNSYRQKTPVRVIRGSTDDKFYTYDGLYDVIDCWFHTGIAGFGVFQFKLSRRPGQPELGSSIVRFMGTVKNRGLARPHLLLGDISGGKERLPVCVVNEVDEEASPLNFTYISKMKYPSWYCPELSQGCNCMDGCVDPSKCLCAAKNGGEFPYNEVGQIVMRKKVVFECGKSCSCPSSCYNRVSQKGLNHQLEVFKTNKRGWGVRSVEPIRPGDFICEYAGELLSDTDAEQRTGCDEYLFDIGHKANSWMDVSELMDVEKGKSIVPVEEDMGFTIDARLYGSVARFINHSCLPNLYAQDVIYDSDDLRFPHVMLFAMENVPPMRELSYDYNYSIGHVRDANGNVKSKPCYCGAQDCRGRLY